MFDFACNGPGFGYGSGMLFTALFWLLIVGLGVWLITWLIARNRNAAIMNNGSISAPSGDTAMEILKRRYARGEISKAEYDALREDLSA